MKLLITFLLAITSIAANAQTDTKRCEVSTDGTGKSLGLKVRFQYPCGWEETPSKSAVKVLKHETGEETVVVQQIVISEPKEPLTPQRIEEMMSLPDMKKQAVAGGTFLWGRRLKIDGVDCAETATINTKKIMSIAVDMYFVTYRMPYKGKMVSIVFAITAHNQAKGKAFFNDNKALMLSLVSATKFLE